MEIGNAKTLGPVVTQVLVIQEVQYVRQLINTYEPPLALLPRLMLKRKLLGTSAGYSFGHR